ncbi:MAG: nitrilase [Candidatus Bathyarchaeota archaeon]|nr:nitrilase [Candidatus Bathyarchaeota archaeon]
MNGKLFKTNKVKPLIDRYTAAIIQFRRIDPEEIPDVAERRKANLKNVLASFSSLETWDVIDPVKLVVLPENILRHEFDTKDPNQTQADRVATAVSIPGEETDAIAEKAKQYNTYVSASIHEKDPKYPEYFLNTAFIMNPKGKIILKYRKINPWIPLELSTSPHDMMPEYKEPMFPVVETELGNLACYVCYDQFFPEVARQLAFNGAEVLLKPTIFPPYPQHMNYEPYDWYTTVNKMRSIENMVYGLNANGAKYGNSQIVDYLGRILAVGDKGHQMTIGATIDIQALRDYRKKTQLHNMLEQVRTECYTYLQKPNWPKNKPLLNEQDYAEWANESKFYKK